MGICDDCQENECPYRTDEEFHSRLQYEYAMEFIKNEILRPEVLIELIEEKVSLFNVINSWYNSQIVVDLKIIENSLILWLPKDIIENIPYEVNILLHNSINVIAQRIVKVLNDECIVGECFVCEIHEQCPCKRRKMTFIV
jgi:hypothetical protein